MDNATYQKRRRSATGIVGAGLVILSALLLILAWLQVVKARNVAHTKNYLHQIKGGVETFYGDFARFPKSIKELTMNEKGITYVDMPTPHPIDDWGNIIVYTRFSTTRGYGAFWSAGPDQLFEVTPTEDNDDLEIRFTIPATATTASRNDALD